MQRAYGYTLFVLYQENVMYELTRLIKEDMIPALGVTEPGAIALAAATARKHTAGDITRITIILNKGLYKNAYTCGIPNSKSYGILHAATLGALAGNPNLGLEVLAEVTEEDGKKAEEMIRTGIVCAEYNDFGSEISIDATVITDKDTCTVRVRDSHTYISEIIKNGETIYSRNSLANAEHGEDGIETYSFKDIINYVEKVPTEELAFINAAFDMNMELFWAGLSSDRMKILPWLYQENGNRILSNDYCRTARLLAAGAIEARVEGLDKPAMSITGSGSHGIICTLPLYAFKGIDPDTCTEVRLLRGTALSFLITMYIKAYSGTLSSFCGCGIAGGTGMACGLGWIRGADEEQLFSIIRIMASGITGMICDGGNRGCAIKTITAVDAAAHAVDMALCGAGIEAIHGINGATPEKTMQNVGMIASPGMTATEDTILDILTEKHSKGVRV